MYYRVDISNHPTHIKKGLPKMIAKRLSTLSKSASEFDSCKQDYEIAIRNSGYKEELVYKELGERVFITQSVLLPV